jgi:REP element-mobilizing transposase RayT
LANEGAVAVKTRASRRDLPPAYFLTFRTYGTWLAGDARGWNSRRRQPDNGRAEHPSSALERQQRSLLAAPPLTLGDQQRAIVDATIREVCQHRDWTLHALNVRTNHVHLVIGTPTRPEPVLLALKAWCTRRLVELGAIPRDRAVWSRHGSTSYLWSADAIERACQYVDEAQEGELWDLRHRPDLPDQP